MDPVLEIVRLETGVEGTFGVLRLQKKVFCFTLEPPDWENIIDKSSIPAQTYAIQSHYSPKFHDTWMVVDVPGRLHILFHAGNTVDHTAGCIILGESIFKLQGDRAVKNSGNTFKRFLNYMQDYEKGTLTIYEVY